MYKILLASRAGLDGSTMVTEALKFHRDRGWSAAELPDAAGVFPAGLWGQVPECDPYLLHACFLTSVPIDGKSFLEVLTDEPTRARVQYTPGPENTRLTLVRPTDRLRLFTPPQQLVKVELLAESVGGTNELGSRLHEWANATARAQDTGVRSVRFDQSAQLAAWSGTLHVVYDGPNAGTIQLPQRQLVPTSAVLTFTRAAGGVPTLVPMGNDKLSGGQPSLQVLRSAFVMNNGEQWTFAGN